MVYIGTWHRRCVARTMPVMAALLTDHEITERVLSHIANRSTDAGDELWREPVENYRSQQRFEAEMSACCGAVTRRFARPTALPEVGSFVSREAAGRPDRGRPRSGRSGARISERLSAPRHARCVRERVREGIRLPLSRLDLRAERTVAARPACRRVSGARQGAARSRAARAVERHGLVFVSQARTAAEADLAGLPELIGKGQKLYATSARETEANWKIVLEGFLEGYHIRATHPETFFPTASTTSTSSSTSVRTAA